jgi:hypothetical protein
LTITAINRAAIDILRRDIDAAVAEVGKKHGLSIKAGNGKYSNGATGSVTVEIATINADGSIESREAQDFRMMAHLYGFQPDDLGRSFTMPLTGETYTITGLKGRAGKRPIIATDRFGKAYVFPEAVARYVQRPEKVTS